MTNPQRVRTRSRHRKKARQQRLTLLWTLILLLAVAAGVLLLIRGGEILRGENLGVTESAPEENLSQDESLPAGWIWREMPEQALSEGNLVLVNRNWGFDPTTVETVSVYENKTQNYLVKDIYLSVAPEAMEALNRWMDAFAAQSGLHDVNIVAGYRTYDDQKSLYDNAYQTKGREYADAYLALPGHSEHHTGLAVDLDVYDVAAGTSSGFDGDGAYAWVVDNAWRYGFIQRYPPDKHQITGINYESWHFRYVGCPHAEIMEDEDLVLEEYVDYLRNFPFRGEHLQTVSQGISYEVYFCKGSRIPVPEDATYTVSGNNVDGFIVTVRREG